MTKCTSAALLVVAALAAALPATVLTTAAHAVTPTSLNVEGVLTSAGGGAAADGSYLLTFALYS